MRPKFKRFVAALAGAATLATPVAGRADGWDDDEKYCSTYEQVESDATGGDYVGGILIYETTAEIERSDPTTQTVTTVTTTIEVGAPVGPSTSATQTVTTTTSQDGTVTTADEPVGYYAMNDGSVYQINCVTDEATQLK